MTDVRVGNHIMKVLDVVVVYENEPIHSCQESTHIFQDFDGTWNLEVGMEFVEITYCPHCGVKLC